MKKPATRDTSGSDVDSRAFGERVRTLREHANLTLEEFSKTSGVSRAMLSKVERAEKSPTIGVAKRIAHALNTPLSVLMGDETRQRAVALVKKDKRQVFKDPETGFERHLLSPIVAGMAVEVVLHLLPAKVSTGKLPPYPAGVGKHVLATRGKVVVGFESQQITLDEGDSLYFDANVEHWFENPTSKASEYYLVISTAPSNRIA